MIELKPKNEILAMTAIELAAYMQTSDLDDPNGNDTCFNCTNVSNSSDCDDCVNCYCCSNCSILSNAIYCRNLHDKPSNTYWICNVEMTEQEFNDKCVELGIVFGA